MQASSPVARWKALSSKERTAEGEARKRKLTEANAPLGQDPHKCDPRPAEAYKSRKVTSAQEIAVLDPRSWIGVAGRENDYVDEIGRTWHSSQTPYNKFGWGGYTKKQPPNIAKFKDAMVGDLHGYDEALYKSVAHGSPNIKVNVGTGLWNVRLIISDHWSPERRRFDILINNVLVQADYVTLGRHVADVVRFPKIAPDASGAIEVNLQEGTYGGDPNAMFAALEFMKEAEFPAKQFASPPAGPPPMRLMDERNPKHPMCVPATPPLVCMNTAIDHDGDDEREAADADCCAMPSRLRKQKLKQWHRQKKRPWTRADKGKGKGSGQDKTRQKQKQWHRQRQEQWQWQRQKQRHWPRQEQWQWQRQEQSFRANGPIPGPNEKLNGGAEQALKQSKTKLPNTQGTPPGTWETCSQCGVYRPFRYLSEEACMQQQGTECDFAGAKPRNPDLMKLPNTEGTSPGKSDTCSQCGVYRLFRYLSEEACLQQQGTECDFAGSKPRNPHLIDLQLLTDVLVLQANANRTFTWQDAMAICVHCGTPKPDDDGLTIYIECGFCERPLCDNCRRDRVHEDRCGGYVEDRLDTLIFAWP